MRAFLDANVLFAAALGGGVSKLWTQPQVQLVTSEYAAKEAWDNLAATPDVGINRDRLVQFLAPPLELVTSQTDVSRPLPAEWDLPDPADIPILWGAILSRCDHLLTGDAKCFGQYFGKTVNGLTVLRPGRFLATLGL